MKYTLGGERVGSGKKMQGSMHNYFRSTFNLSEKWASSAGAGILYPSMVKLAMRGDTFNIEVDQDARTIPTLGPLFGTFKMQTDIYQVPVRLYQGILHNNPLAIGLKMGQVLFPTLDVETYANNWKTDNAGKMNNSCLLKYLGLSGIGKCQTNEESTKRTINALPALSYYDIFKTYYANKQEEKAYVISATQKQEHLRFIIGAGTTIEKYVNGSNFTRTTPWYTGDELNVYTGQPAYFRLEFNNATDAKKILENAADQSSVMITFSVTQDPSTDTYELTIDDILNNKVLSESLENGLLNISAKLVEYEQDNILKYYVFLGITSTTDSGQPYTIFVSPDTNIAYNKTSELALQKFDLENIDEMRYELLSHHELGTAYSLNSYNKLPYNALFAKDDENHSLNEQPLNGLVLKTYQNDIYNNWLNTEWIEGENGVNELSKVAIVDGAFSMDSFIFATKLFNMLNRIAVAGATYEDWQDVVYEEVKRRQIESPIFIASISNEIVFDEIVQTAPAEGQPLGELGGRGRADERSKNGGRAHIKCDEACFIIAITSLTPRQFYTQGNEFYMTDVFSMDDLHKPAMDGIGFQDLIGERMAWFDTILDTDGVVTHRSKIGKLPAWIEYMTSVDRAYGDFAETEGKGYMILNRNYEEDKVNGGIKDATTYIDPQKYNYVFAYDALDAQNFWLEINFRIQARRLMSARLIPNV